MSTIELSEPTDSEPAPEEEAESTDRLARMPAWLRYSLYAAVGVLIMATAREISGAGALTSENTFRYALQLALPIGLAGLGGLWSERAGVVNIGLEGMLVLGTWFGAYGAITWGAWQGVAFGVLGGMLGGLLHAIATVSFGVDHIISGVAINLLGVGMTLFLTSVAWEGATKESPQFDPDITRVDLLPFLEQPLTDLAGENRFFISDAAKLLLAVTTEMSLLILLALALFPLTWFMLWRTPVGLRLRSVGEDPEAADSLGVKVYALKYLAVMVSGGCAGLGGVVLVYLFAGRFSSGQTGGRGYIGLAAMIFGNWRPGGLVAGAGLFGFMDAMQLQPDRTAHALLVVGALVFVAMTVRMLFKQRWLAAGSLAALAALMWIWYEQTEELPRELVPYFPHLTTLAVLVFAAQRLRMPAADGKVYRRSGR